MSSDVRDVGNACMKRWICKKPSHAMRSPYQPYQAGTPLDHIQLDILGLLPMSNSGHKYILVIVDHFTKWAEAYPLADQMATLVAEKNGL